MAKKGKKMTTALKATEIRLCDGVSVFRKCVCEALQSQNQLGSITYKPKKKREKTPTTAAAIKSQK